MFKNGRGDSLGDIKLFHKNGDSIKELEGNAMAVEKSLQEIFEKNLEILLGIRFLASEYSTGKKHAGRIDTLGIDENNSPVIIEYKRAMNENVINQGLFYLDWLLDHKAEFELMVLRRYGEQSSNNIDWSNPRLLCIAGGFTKYDAHAVQQINRNIELFQYKQFQENLLLLDLVNATTANNGENDPEIQEKSGKKKQKVRTVSDYLEKADQTLTDLYDSIKTYLLALGDDVQIKTLKHYIAFKRIKNFACIEIHPNTNKILLYLKVDPDSIDLVPGFSRDVRSIGHFGTGDLELTISSVKDFEQAKELIMKSYDVS